MSAESLLPQDLPPMPSSNSAPTPVPRPEPIAHLAHTIVFLFILLLTTLYGHLHSTPAIVQSTPHITRYISSMLYEWLLLGAVVAGIYHRGTFFDAALFPRIPSLAVSFARGIAIYLLGLFAILAVGAALYYTPLRGLRNEAVLHALLPQTIPQLGVWFLVSLTAGICEELVFRGYLLQQFIAWTGRPVLSVLLSGLIFGSIHLYEGLGAILPIAALGIVFGLVVVRFRGDLRAVILAHTLQDFLTGLFVFAQPYAERHAHQLDALITPITANIFSLSSFFS
jgi:membrane protease YdiL (CAAX protease family)